MLKKISIFLSENPNLRYWIVRPEWVAVILLIISIILQSKYTKKIANIQGIIQLFSFVTPIYPIYTGICNTL